MRAFNKRKLPREHRLFLTRGKELNFTRTERCVYYSNQETTYTESTKIRITKCNKVTYIVSNSFDMRVFYKHYIKLLKMNGKKFRIQHFEELHKIKIEEIGLSSSDFTLKNYDKNITTKFYEALKKYVYKEGVLNGK